MFYDDNNDDDDYDDYDDTDDDDVDDDLPASYIFFSSFVLFLSVF